MFKKFISKIVPVLPQIIASLFLTGFVVFAAWQEPSQAPPGGNVDTPLNTGLTGQIKSGNLQVNALGVQGTGNAFLVPYGNVGIGTATPSEKLEVSGSVKISSGGEIKNLRTENVFSLPAAGSAGRMVFN